MSLKTKMIAFCLLVGILPLSVIGMLSFNVASQSLKSQALGQLESVRDVKRDYLGYMLDRWKREVDIYAGVKEVYNAVGMLRDFAMGVKPGARADVDSPEYDDIFKYVAGAFEPFVKKLGFADALLIGDDGRVLLTLDRGKDNGEDLLKGRLLQDSNLRQAFEQAMAGRTMFVDFAPYPPLDGEPAAFVAAPVRDYTGKVAGVAALRVSLAELNALMNIRSGMGLTGETFLVGPDGTMRSDSFRDPQNRGVKASMTSPAKGSVDTESVRLALQGKSGIHEALNYQGVPVLSAYAPFDAGGIRWALSAEIEEAEAFAPSRLLGRSAVVMGLVVGVVVAGVTIVFLRRELLTPLYVLRTFAEHVAAGELGAGCDGRFKAELARVRQAIMAMVQNLKDKLDEVKRNADIARDKTAEAEAALAQAERAKAAAVDARSEGVLEASRTLESVARRINDSVASLEEQATSVSRGAGTQRERAGETSRAMEQMNATILDIARNASSAAHETDQARDNARQGAAIVSEAVAAIHAVSEQAGGLKTRMAALGQRAESIGQIIEVISDIADQTNLLALNAAIEAARAGEAGRGFAVVADEVRKLAEKTMNATREVNDVVKGIQDEARGNVAAMDSVTVSTDRATELAGASGQALSGIVGLVTHVSDNVQGIAAAIEQQTATTEQISRTMEEISHIAAKTDTDMTVSMSTVERLADLSHELENLIVRMQSEAAA